MDSIFNRKLGKSGIITSPLGFGCWAIGGPFRMDGLQDGWGEVDDKISKNAILEAIQYGVTFFDTADAYGTGHSEEVLGDTVKEFRNKVVIATKFGFTYNSQTRELTGTDASPDYIRRACEASLRRLKTDYIDLYQLHVGSIPHEQIDSVIEALSKLQFEGLIRAYGWSTGDVECARIFAENSNCAAIQHAMNVFGYEKGILELCEKHQMASINNAPLAMGLLSGKFNADTTFSSQDVRGNAHAWLKYFEGGKPRQEFLDKLDAIRELLRSEGRTLVQGALAWLWAKSENNIPIPGFKNPEQVRENAKAIEFGPLTPKQMDEIDGLLNSIEQ
ncbi:MAG: aldo/keto reductase [Clostridia bacterium]|nr:aldo/keto reductase [Clostridia bacterium]